MSLNLKEIKTRELLFSKTWADCCNEDSSEQRSAIEQTAQGVLEARVQFASSSLADLYDPLTMPPAMLQAHQKLDTAVVAAYQPSGGKKSYASDAERVAFLFELYQRITRLLPKSTVKKTRKIKATES